MNERGEAHPMTKPLTERLRNSLSPRDDPKVLPVHAAPGRDGELGLEWEHGGVFVGIEITANGDVTWIIRQNSKFLLGGQTWVPGLRPYTEWTRTVVDRLDADASPPMKTRESQPEAKRTTPRSN